MVEPAAHLVDHVFPETPLRQWVLTFPLPLRFLLAAQPEALTQVLAVIRRGISTFVIHHAGLPAQCGFFPRRNTAGGWLGECLVWPSRRCLSSLSSSFLF
jgi:hypothetical protein